MVLYVRCFTVLVAACAMVCMMTAGCEKPARPKVQRFGSVVGLRPEKRELYNKLHGAPWPEIVAKIQECNIHNYSIYEVELAKGKWYLFSYFEYTGSDFKADMQKMADDPKTQEWWKLTDPCQVRIPGTPEGEQWLSIREVYHSD